MQDDICTLIPKQLPITKVPGECKVLPQQNWNDYFFCHVLLGKRLPVRWKYTVNQTLTNKRNASGHRCTRLC